MGHEARGLRASQTSEQMSDEIAAQVSDGRLQPGEMEMAGLVGANRSALRERGAPGTQSPRAWKEAP